MARIHLNPDRRLVRLYAALAVAAYWLFYFLLQDMIPEKYLRDAAFIQYLAEGNEADTGGAFALMASLLQMLPLPVSNALVGFINGVLIFAIIDRVRTQRGILLTLILLPPLFLLTMMAPTKETIVTLMSASLCLYAWRAQSDTALMLAIGAIYLFYGCLFRPYYLLILFFFICYALLLKDKGLFRLLAPLSLALALLLAPPRLFAALEGARDTVNYFVGFGAHYDVRTAFGNPFPPDNAWHFLLNYGFAFLRLHFAFLWDMTINEIALFANILIDAWLIATGVQKLTGPPRLLPVLFLAHITVLLFFEPDLGSYFRHFSSVFFYLLPAFAYTERQRADRIDLAYAPRAAS